MTQIMSPDNKTAAAAIASHVTMRAHTCNAYITARQHSSYQQPK
jgi:hypothetical protein